MSDIKLNDIPLLSHVTEGVHPTLNAVYSRGSGKSKDYSVHRMIAQMISDGLSQELLNFELSEEHDPQTNGRKYFLKHKTTGRMIASSNGNELTTALQYLQEHPYTLYKYLNDTHIENWSTNRFSDKFQDHEVPDFVKKATELPAEDRSDLEAMALLLFELQQRPWSNMFTQDLFDVRFDKYEGNPCQEIAMSGEPLETHRLVTSNGVRMMFNCQTGELTRVEPEGKVNPEPHLVTDSTVEWGLEPKGKVQKDRLAPI